MKIIHTMRIEDVPGTNCIEVHGTGALIHYDAQVSPQKYSLEALIEFRDALTVMIDHLASTSDPEPKSEPELGPKEVVDGVGSIWYRAPNGFYTVYLPGNDRQGEACWTIDRIDEIYGLRDGK